MVTDSDSPQLQVLGREGPVALANMSGANNPVAILDDGILDLLVVQCRKAKEEARDNRATANDGAILALFATLTSILDPYVQIRNKYYSGAGDECMYAAAQSDLKAAIKALEKFNPRKR